jgi:hypothetical protein
MTGFSITLLGAPARILRLPGQARERKLLNARIAGRCAKVAEWADAPDLGSGPARGGGSNPPFRTNATRRKKRAVRERATQGPRVVTLLEPDSSCTTPPCEGSSTNDGSAIPLEGAAFDACHGVIGRGGFAYNALRNHLDRRCYSMVNPLGFSKGDRIVLRVNPDCGIVEGQPSRVPCFRKAALWLLNPWDNSVGHLPDNYKVEGYGSWPGSPSQQSARQKPQEIIPCEPSSHPAAAGRSFVAPSGSRYLM